MRDDGDRPVATAAVQGRTRASRAVAFATIAAVLACAAAAASSVAPAPPAAHRRRSNAPGDEDSKPQTPPRRADVAAAAGDDPPRRRLSAPPLPQAPVEDPTVANPRAPDRVVTRATNSELVDLGHPGAPFAAAVDADCPHLESGLVPWSTAVGSVVAKQVVVIDGGQKVLLSSSPGVKLKRITVKFGSELIFADQPIQLETKSLEIFGKLRAGSETCRLRSEITVTLHGSRPSEIPARVRTKGIDVNGGTLDIHSVEYYHTWSRLAVTALPGDTYVLLQDRVNWDGGQTVVVTTTELKDARDWHQNEVLQVADVKAASHLGMNITAVFLSEPLAFTHYGGDEYQAEVGLLSRRFKIQGGESNSEPTDVSPLGCHDGKRDYASYPCANHLTGYGGHIVIRGASGVGRLSGVELYRMGQTNFRGRYPLHWHLVGDGGLGSYIQDSSIHRSFFKCVAIHGTNDVRVSRNVAYDAIGHCVYFEDGVEERNTIEYNLIAHVHPIGKPPGNAGSTQDLPRLFSSPDLVTPADATAAAVYISNAHNRIKGNAAVGGWSGYQFPVFVLPLGHHRDAAVVPRKRTGIEFDGNSCRSTGHWWGRAACVYAGGNFWHTDGPDSTDPDAPLAYDPGRSDTLITCDTPANDTYTGCNRDDWAWLVVTNLKVALSTIGLNTWGGRFRLEKFEMHDVVGGPSLFLLGRHSLDQALVTGRTVHGLATRGFCDETVPHYGDQTAYASTACKRGSYDRRWTGRRNSALSWYDAALDTIFTRVTFRNFDATTWPEESCEPSSDCLESHIFRVLTHSSINNPEWMGITADLKYEPEGQQPKIVWFDNSRHRQVSGQMAGWLDFDGSAFNRREWGRTIVGSNFYAGEWWKLHDDCEEVGEFAESPADTSRRVMWCCQARGHLLASATFRWDSHYDNQTEKYGGGSYCNNTAAGICPVVGYMAKFGDTDLETQGFEVAMIADIVGPVATEESDEGIGWYLHLDKGAPKELKLTLMQVHTDARLFLAIAYPKDTGFNITMAVNYLECPSWGIMCSYTYQEVENLDSLIASDGDSYFVDRTGEAADILYLRIVSRDPYYLSLDNSTWDAHYQTPTFTSSYMNAQPDGIGIPTRDRSPELTIIADCTTGSGDNQYYCAGGRLPSVNAIPPLLWNGVPTPQPTLAVSLVPLSTTLRLQAVGTDNDGRVLGPLYNGAVINRDILGVPFIYKSQLGIEAVFDGPVGSVRFNLDDGEFSVVDNAAPYTLWGDDGEGDFFPAFWPDGSSHTLSVTPYTQSNASGREHEEVTVAFSWRFGADLSTVTVVEGPEGGGLNTDNDYLVDGRTIQIAGQTSVAVDWGFTYNPSHTNKFFTSFYYCYKATTTPSATAYRAIALTSDLSFYDAVLMLDDAYVSTEWSCFDVPVEGLLPGNVNYVGFLHDDAPENGTWSSLRMHRNSECLETLDFSMLPVQNYTSWKVHDDIWTVKQRGCAVELAETTWKAFALPENHIVNGTSNLHFCFKQQHATCKYSVIAAAPNAKKLSKALRVAVAGSSNVSSHIQDFRYVAPLGEMQCFSVPLSDYVADGTIYTHVAFLNECESGDNGDARFSKVRFTGGA